jgi:hypothetical protein
MIGTLGPYTSASEQAHGSAQLLKRDGQVHGDRGLAHAALSAGDGNEILHALDGQ